MGGKTKQAQRTKNNARPSSSGRSAEFLGSSVPAFVGFTAVENCGFVPVVPGFATSEAITEEIDANVDANYQLIMRKMSKKDPITKSKALQEFCDLVTSSDVDLVKTILPFWPRLYINLATDVEHRVREGAQQAHGTLSAKAGKFLAPFLRQIAPVWITSQYDSYAPAASLAIASFQRSFPPHKLKEVFSFCQNEFLDYITKILTVHTATTLSNSKSYTSEECEAKYQRTVSCCLQGYAQYLRTVNDENLNEVTNNNITLIEHQKFWNFHKHKSPNIRSAWFEAVSMVVQKIPHLLEKHTAQVVNAAFQNLDENDPIVLPHLWQAVLLIQVNLPTWSKHVNWEKMLLPKLWKVLKNGSSVTYPHLLPFISRINIEILENEEKLLKFYGNFFENFSEGLRNRHGSLTKWELNTLITSYFECVQFVIMQLLKQASTTSSYRDFSDKLLSDHVLDTIFWCMTVGFHCGKCVYGKIATLMTSWSQNSTSNDEYKALTENFWAKMFPVIERSVEIVGKDLNSKTESHVNFCHCLKYSMTHRLLKNNKVKFEPAAEEHAPSTEKSTPKPVYEDQLQDLVLKICRMYLRSIIELRNPTFIPKLQNLFAEFGCFQLYSDLTEDGDLSGLLSRFELMLADGKLRQEFIVDMIIKLYDHFPDDKKREILKNLIENPHRIVCNWIITRILSHPLCTEPGISEILSQEKVKKHLVDQAAVASQSTTLESFNLLHKCFFQTESGEILIDNDTCSEIIDKIATTLNASQDKLVLDSCGSFLAQVMPVICEDASKASIQKQMFITLFRFTVNQSDVPPEGDDQHVWEIMTSWQDSLSIGDLHLTDSLAETCCQIIGGKLHEIPTDCVEHLAEVASKLILCSSEGLPKDSEIPEFIDKMIDNVLNLNMGQYRKHQSFAKHLSLHIQAINQKLTTLEMSPDEEIQSMDHDSSLKMFFQASLFKILVITKLCCKIKRARKEKTSDVDDPEVEEEEDTDDFCDSEANQLVKSSKEIHSQILEGFFALACGETFLLHGSLLNPEVEEKIHQLGASVEVMLKNCPEELRVTLKEKLFQKANQEGGIWANSLTILKNCPEYEGDNGPVLLYEDAASTLEDSETLLTYVNILQSLTPSIPPKCLPVVPNLFENLTNMMISTASNRCLVTNNFSGDFNDFEDRKIMGNCLKILTAAAIRIKSKDLHSLYNINLKDLSTSDVIFTVELANFIGQLLLNFSAELEDAHWDFIRIALSSWVLTASKSVENYVDSNIAIFLASVFKLFAAMESFVIAEKTKSSTDRLTKIVEEWEHVFAQDGHLVLLRVFMYIVQDTKGDNIWKNYLLDYVCPCVEQLDMKYVILGKKVDKNTTQGDLIEFCLKSLSHENHAVRMAVSTLLVKLTPCLISDDWQVLNKRSEQEQQRADNSWHALGVFFRPHIDRHNVEIAEYMRDFSFKINELGDLPEFPREKALPYLLLWDFAINMCRRAPSELRSLYAQWIVDSRFEHVILPTLFRLMPMEVLKNWDTKVPLGETLFTVLNKKMIANPSVSVGRFACHIYGQTLRYLPVLARKWWQDLAPRQKLLVDKVTTVYVSPMLCQEELRALTEERRQENMLISVHTSTREVIATYSIDEARMELTVTLPPNYPLGPVKVDGGKQIGGRLQSRVVVMQLTIFLTHQNGTINDGLSLWKRNLDKKFEGVEECYVCYSVIHQDTCQLPKLTCKTCRKKFHGPCLYKWFSTSNKSTCPICRNIF